MTKSHLLAAMTLTLVLTGCNVAEKQTAQESIADTKEAVIEKVQEFVTYANEEYGFEFQYPSDWEIRQYPLKKGDSVFVSKTEGNYKQDYFSIVPDVLTGTYLGAAMKSETETEVDGVKATKEHYIWGNLDQPDTDGYYMIYIMKNDRTVEYTIEYPSNDDALYEKIVNSIKFSDPSELPETAAEGFETYQNDELGITFQYPSSFGKARGSRYKGGTLNAIHFYDAKGERTELSLGSQTEYYSSPLSCDDFPEGSFPIGDIMITGCETIHADDPVVLLLSSTIQVMEGASGKSLLFETKQGIWALGAPEENLVPIAKTLEYLESEPSGESLLSEAEAQEIAERDCIKGGESVDEGYYNPNSQTWWFDANLNVSKEGCNPACVVYEDGTTEINWRCTGVISE